MFCLNTKKTIIISVNPHPSAPLPIRVGSNPNQTTLNTSEKMYTVEVLDRFMVKINEDFECESGNIMKEVKKVLKLSLAEDLDTLTIDDVSVRIDERRIIGYEISSEELLKNSEMVTI